MSSSDFLQVYMKKVLELSSRAYELSAKYSQDGSEYWSLRHDALGNYLSPANGYLNLRPSLASSNSKRIEDLVEMAESIIKMVEFGGVELQEFDLTSFVQEYQPYLLNSVKKKVEVDDARVLFNKPVLRSVLDNLAKNSKIHGSRDSASLGLSGLDNFYLLSFEDNGVGVKSLDKLFTEGYTTRKSVLGHGMGLFNSKRLVRKSGGDLGYWHKPEGARFYLVIPKQ